MKSFIEILIGLSIIFLLGYTLVMSILILAGYSDKTFDDISTQLVISLIFMIIFIHGFVSQGKKGKTSNTQQVIEQEKASPIEKKQAYNPEFDKLHFGIYEQSCKTNWLDSDGDSYSTETEYANLRFYEDGVVIGIRQQAVLKKENPDSYVYKGTYIVKENTIELELNKVSDVNDKIFHYISPEEQRNMKYAGHIADDNDLIKQGKYKGHILGDSLTIGKFKFNLIKPSNLIITTSESNCNSLMKKFKDHPLVISSFTDSGYWYSNGETGPEWHTVTFKSRYELREGLEKDLKNCSIDFSNMFWG
ncbi:hypothetical protein EV195_101855 [Tenacibaculum skagerrakense]|uniref:Uncharacterized protein n=2 Tax=Tenacibaculum skagerrakense TaxID=186571 RepID=A0A4R2P3R8_9FLAO|nr:hypothetical protein EV195_101855 [Tenacibaculum skagerrakense]